MHEKSQNDQGGLKHEIRGKIYMAKIDLKLELFLINYKIGSKGEFLIRKFFLKCECASKKEF